MLSPAMSPKHVRNNLESVGPMAKLAQTLKDDVARLNQYRSELESLIKEYLVGNTVRQHFIMTRAIKL